MRSTSGRRPAKKRAEDGHPPVDDTTPCFSRRNRLDSEQIGNKERHGREALRSTSGRRPAKKRAEDGHPPVDDTTPCFSRRNRLDSEQIGNKERHGREALRSTSGRRPACGRWAHRLRRMDATLSPAAGGRPSEHGPEG
jgi:hypothetical protein